MHPMPPIDACIPHRGAMRLIDRVLSYDADSVVVEARIPFDGVFLEAAGMPAWIGIEYMAQAIAAWAGVLAYARGDVPKLGFLLGTRRYACSRGHFRQGLLLRVEARREVMADNGLGVFACDIFDRDEALATALVSVFEPDDAGTYLQGTDV
jgi:predicted hotdog family 3-hydroxylacyl-ACP dehydratase